MAKDTLDPKCLEQQISSEGIHSAKGSLGAFALRRGSDLPAYDGLGGCNDRTQPQASHSVVHSF